MKELQKEMTMDENEKNNQEMNDLDNTITLLNGTTLVCYPKTEHQDHLKEKDARKKKEQDDRFFLDHAFAFYKNADRIFQDSRMFLAPVPASGLFKHSTLGILLEWWIYGDEDFRKDKEGNDAFTYYIAGSPLTGSNLCACVYPDGTTQNIRHRSFKYAMKSLGRFYGRYKGLQRFDAYSLQEVWEILSCDPNDASSMLAAKLRIQESRNVKLNKQLSALQNRYDELSKKFEQICIKHYQKELDEFRDEYKRREQETEDEIEKIREQRRALRAQFKSGALDLMTYQELVSPLARMRRQLETKLKVFKAEQIHQLLSNNDITYITINNYINNDTSYPNSEQQ